MTERMNPRNDFVFQRIFGSEENKDILLSFLNGVFKPPKGQELTDIEILSTKLNKERISEKSIVLDIRARTAEGVQINIEIQLVNRYNVEKRTLFYWSRLFNSQLPSGDDYKMLKKTVTINILDFEYLPLERYHSTYHLREDHTYHQMTDVLEIHFIELPKLFKENANLDDLLVDWMLFLKGIGNELMEEIVMKVPEIRKAMTVLDILSQDQEARILYEMREKALHDEASMLSGAREEGIKEGIKEGERKKAVEFAKKLLQKGMDIDSVAELTDLPIEEIRVLQPSSLN
jgi:predicted transposase/invertase (TIGR01784 family)